MRPCKHAAHPCTACLKNRARVRAWTLANPERVRARHRRFNASPKGQARHRAYNGGWGASKRGCLSVDQSVTLDAVFARDDGVCWLCGRDDVAPPGDQQVDIRQRASIDHVVPIKRGGPHAWGNVRLAHVGCNIRRGCPDVDVSPGECRVGT